MASITVLKDPPPPARTFWPWLLIIGGGFLAISGLASIGEEGAGTLLLGAAIAGIGWLWRWLSKSAANQRRIAHATWLEQAQGAVDQVNALERLPTVEVALSLQSGEECYWFGEASWYEFRKVTKRVNYSGLTASIPIAKGIRYRVGSIAPAAERESELVPIDHGTLYVTNKRLFFDGREKNTTLTWRSLVGVQLFEGGIMIEKGTGKSPHLMIRDGAERAAALIARQF